MSADQGKGENQSMNNKMTSTKGSEFERIRQNLVKRSLDVKFDIRGTDYKPIENIGIGAYGVVCSAIHAKTDEKVAIKKIHSVFDAVTIAKRTYREIKILKHFKHDNIICIKEILLPKEGFTDFKDIYVVFDLMESDLHRIIYSDQPLTEEHIRYFLYQILRGLKYIHSANVVHRDLKPSNLLVNEDCHLRIGDFGMARGVFHSPNEPSYYMTQYVATRWYRAPEILLSMLEYGTALDMWSVGCIFAEMMGRKHLFPGKDYISQVKLILGILGTPTEDVLKNCQIDLLRKMIKSLGKKDPVSWGKLFPKASKKSLDLVGKMLVLKPSNRITVEQALSHRLFNHYHDPDDEPICVPPFNFDFEKEDMDKKKLRNSIMDEIMDFHKPKTPTLSFSAFLRPVPKREGEITKKDNREQLTQIKLGTLSSVIPKEDPTQVPSHIDALPGASTSKVSPVSVKTSQLSLAPPCSDIEMLSAQSSDGHVMDTQQSEAEIVKNLAPLVAEKPQKATAVSDKKEKNTISEDTKALVKQALMNASQRRQRAESQSEDVDKSKPITAAQRQKEREDRRRKKREKAMEKVKKAKCKKATAEKQFNLTNEDVELLRRWTVMQTPAQLQLQQQQQGTNQPSPAQPEPSYSPPANSNSNNVQSSHSKRSQSTSDAPKISKPRQILAKSATPITLSQPSLNISSQLNTGGTVIFPSQQFCLSQTNFVPVIAIPSLVNHGKLEIKRIVQPQSQTQDSGTSGMSTSDNTKSLLQNSILMRQQRGTVSMPTSQSLNAQNAGKQVPAFHFTEDGDPTKVGYSAPANANSVPGDENDNAQVTAHLNTDAQTNLFGLDKNDVLSLACDPDSSVKVNDFLDQRVKTDSNVDGNSLTGDSFFNTPSFIQTQDVLAELKLATQDDSSSSQSSSRSPQPGYPLHHSPEQRQNPSGGASYSSVSPVPTSPPTLQNEFNVGHDLLIGSFQNQSDFPLTFPTSEDLPSGSQAQEGNSFVPSYHSDDDFSALLQQESDLNFNTDLNPEDLFKDNATSSSYRTQTPELHHSNRQHQPILFNDTTGLSDALQHIESTNVDVSLPYARQSDQFNAGFAHFGQSHQNQQQGFQQSQGNTPSFGQHSSNQGELLQQPFPSSASNMASSSNIPSVVMDTLPSTSGHRLTVDTNKGPASQSSDPQSDLIALLSKQLSKSQVVDIFPPCLALTPKGTGAGYGVGMDLESMLTDAQDNNSNNRVEQSPLSSSLLADWLDLSENFSQADIEALEREFALQSPMHVSFSDVNL